MFTTIDKNLLIAAMESAIYHACVNANVVSLHAIETGVSALRQRFDQNPESVTDDDVFGMVDTIERAAIPPLATIDAINNDTSIIDRVVSYLWRNIVDKPSTFPPTAHEHDAYALTGHAHADLAALTHTHDAYALNSHAHADLAALTHTHDAYALTGHAHADLAALTHTHDAYALNSHAHADLAALTHQHTISDISNFPATILSKSEVGWMGNGATSRSIAVTGQPDWGIVSYLGTDGGIMQSDGSVVTFGGSHIVPAFGLTSSLIVINDMRYNAAGAWYSLYMFRGVS